LASKVKKTNFIIAFTFLEEKSNILGSFSFLKFAFFRLFFFCVQAT